ncbi:ABC transporter substrate-binding protein [Halobacteriales archaeon QH_3_68_24]|nr:MAG: ABC transporter substrate-binding protein [Halobacteriales archaeon QH_3_68_24]
MLAAGSLQKALESGLAPHVEPTVQVEARGSVELARQVAEGQKDPDVVAVADDGLFGSTLDAPWHAVFATNAIVLAYNPETEGGQRVGAAAPGEWYRPLVDGDVTLGRTDPDLDPLGYRTLFALELAADHYGTATDLRAAVTGPDQTYPETQLVSQLETGSVDAAFVYRNMAVERDYASVDLPAAADLSDPARADAYATATYELPDGTTVEGDVIRYAATARRESEAVRDVFESCVAGDYLASYGFARPEGYPRFTDDAPDGVAN